MRPTTASWAVIAVGAAICGIGYSLLPDRLGAGMLGFGLAHLILGVLDLFRAPVRR